MGAFTIYFFVLTGIYLVYYCVIVLMDLFGKKGKKDGGMETIAVTDAADDDDEQYQVVSEGRNGEFTISRPDDGNDDGDDDDRQQYIAEEEAAGYDAEPSEGEVADDTVDEYGNAVIPDEEQEGAGVRSGSVVDDDEDYEQLFEESKAAAEEAATPVRPNYQYGYDLATARVALGQPMSQKSKILRSVVTIS